MLRSSGGPDTVAYCHCSDCRRLTGAPVAVFAAFDAEALAFSPPLGAAVSHSPGVERWFCTACGSPLAAKFDYLPGQIYVPVGILDQADDVVPEIHCHHEARLQWLDITDDLPRIAGSGRGALNGRDD